MNKFAVGCLHYYVMWQHVDEMKAASIFLQFLRFWKHLFNCLCCLASCYHCIKDNWFLLWCFWAGRWHITTNSCLCYLLDLVVWALIHPSFSCAGEAIGATVASFLEDAMVFEVEYCACCHLQRNILSNSSQAFSTENFRVLTESGQTGVSYSITPEFSWRKSEAYCKLSI